MNDKNIINKIRPTRELINHLQEKITEYPYREQHSLTGTIFAVRHAWLLEWDFYTTII